MIAPLAALACPLLQQHMITAPLVAARSGACPKPIWGRERGCTLCLQWPALLAAPRARSGLPSAVTLKRRGGPTFRGVPEQSTASRYGLPGRGGWCTAARRALAHWRDALWWFKAQEA
jgi:hypothetical protein